MLCNRSASLISRTRQSSAMATSILRMVAACWASLELNWRRSSLVTPSTTRATPSPNVCSIVSSVSPGVLHRIVQERRRHGLGVEAQLGDDRRHGHRVRDVGLAGAPELTLVRRGGRPPGLDDQCRVVLGPVHGELGQQRHQEVAQGPLLSLLGIELWGVRGSHPGEGHHPSRLPAWGNTGNATARRQRPMRLLSAFSAAASCPCSGAAAGPAADPASARPPTTSTSRRPVGPSPPSPCHSRCRRPASAPAAPTPTPTAAGARARPDRPAALGLPDFSAAAPPPPPRATWPDGGHAHLGAHGGRVEGRVRPL